MLNRGILHVSQRLIIQKGLDRFKETKQSWDMGVYYKEELEQLVKNDGFMMMKHESSKWESRSSNFIVAKKP
jgi:hypothetical protein